MTDEWDEKAGISENEDGTFSKVSPYKDGEMDYKQGLVDEALIAEPMPDIPKGASEAEIKRIIRESLIKRAGKIAHVSVNLKDIIATVNALKDEKDLGLPHSQMTLLQIINITSGHTSGIPSSHTEPKTIEHEATDE
jgi:hypothetical protein